MTINIISRGIPKSEKVFKGTCMDCRSVLECKREDGEFTSGTQREPGDMVAINCPVCHNRMYCYDTH